MQAGENKLQSALSFSAAGGKSSCVCVRAKTSCTENRLSELLHSLFYSQHTLSGTSRNCLLFLSVAATVFRYSDVRYSNAPPSPRYGSHQDSTAA